MNVLKFADPAIERETHITAMFNTVIDAIGTDADRTEIVNALLAGKWSPGVIATHLNDVFTRLETFHRTHVDKDRRAS